MALMFPRVARNFAKNGYYPTDEPTLERILTALAPSPGTMCILDPCAGEGVAIAEVAHTLGRDSVRAYAVEYDSDRAKHARLLVDYCLHADVMDTSISSQSVGLLFLNPPYGDLVSDAARTYRGHGRARLEKLFFQRSVPLLQYDGILALIVPASTLDAELVGWLTHQFTDLRLYRAIETRFRQVVIFGRRIRQRERASDDARLARTYLLKIGQGDAEPEELPATWPFDPYTVPPSQAQPKAFYRITLEPEQFALEVQRLHGLWPSFDTILCSANRSCRPPARKLSDWHLALALAAGEISGVIRSKTGRVLIVKGDTHKGKSLRVTCDQDADGSVCEKRILTDRFIPKILAWDMTPGSPTMGQVLTIR